MRLPKSTPAELVADLRELARAAAADLFPAVQAKDTIEGEAAEFIDEAARLLREIAEGGGPFAERARTILDRLT